MDRAQAQQYLLRWQAVEMIRKGEARAGTLDLRWRQLNAIYCLSRNLGLISHQPDDMRGYERWARLKERVARASKV